MIIKGKAKKGHSFGLLIGLIGLLIPLLFFKFYDDTSRERKKDWEPFIVECDLEKVEDEAFVNNGHRFLGVSTRSDDNARSGKYSSKLEGENVYGVTYKLKNPTPGKQYKAEVWSYNQHPVDAFLVVSDPTAESFYLTSDYPVERQGDFWQRWELLFKVPEGKKIEELKVYVYRNKGPNSIYFDDLKIQEVINDLDMNYEVFEPQKIQLIIDQEGLDKLEQNRNKSIAQGLVFHDGSKISAKLWDGKATKKVKIRHKGDWLDHMGKHPSYRIDMASEDSWNGMQSFSIQEPHTRGFLREWLFFKFLEHADVIYPRYDFVSFQQNKKDPVIFAYEEHFTKNLVENRYRREGPILKFTEDRIWETTKRTMKGWKNSLPTIDEKDKAYWTSEIKPFKESKALKNPKLSLDFEAGQKLMYQFKYGLKPASQIFDLDRMAKYLALVDICSAHHAVTWHNQRFYYNPVTALLEPIGFDAYSAEDPENYAFYIYAEKLYTKGQGHREPIDDLFYDDAFVKRYLHFLNYYSNKNFLDKFLSNLEESIVEREHFIRQKHANYKLDREFIKKKAARIRTSLPAHINSLQAFYNKNIKDKRTVELLNQHGFPLEILTGAPSDSLSNIIYPKKWEKQPETRSWKVPLGTKSIDYQIPGIDSIYSVNISPWTAPSFSETPRQALNTIDVSQPNDLFNVTQNYIEFKEGLIEVDQPLIFPKGYVVLFKEGTHIKFQDEGFILSYSPVKFLGDSDNPILVEGNGSNGSITVLQADALSIVRNTVFTNQNTLKYGTWGLTGAVNFYESEVNVIRSKFNANQCEDALNIIRSDFKLEESSFHKTYGDAFDADFCDGEIINTRFTEIGNDAIDVSGSVIKIEGTTIDGTGDKGISAGEWSKMHVHWTTIDHSIIGIASKDKSQVYGNNVTIKNCQTGLTAFQKKPEFGPATINLKSTSIDNSKRDYLAEEGSIIKLQ